MNIAWRPALAELIGTFAFVFIGAGSIVMNHLTGGEIGLTGIALAHGLALAIMVSTFGAISGGHLNPAVTVALWVARKISHTTVLFYIAAQLTGGALAGFLLRAFFPESAWQAVNLGTPGLVAGVTPLVGLGLEAVLTFFLVLTVLGTAVDSMAPKIGGFGIGLIVAADIFVGGPLTGAAMNPARVFGPGLASGYWAYHWVYWFGPLAGAAAASWIYTRLLSKTI